MYKDYLPDSVSDFEDLLRRKEYKAPNRLRYSKLSAKLREGVYKMDAVVSFGSKIINLLDDMTEELHRLPTPTEYIKQGLVYCEEYWKENRFKDKKINGYPFNKGVKLGCADRLLRAYISKVIEIHLQLLLKSLGWTVFEHPLVDSLMGVDVVAENHKKRYYIHVTTSKQGEAGAIRSVKAKERRGNVCHNGKWIKFSRDFSGDVVLCYPTIGGSGIVRFVNNIPLFTKEYINFYFDLKDISSKHGEPLDATPTKLDRFKEWVSANLKIEIE